ncbi:hypothetical protein EDC01DRAFT_595868, partial [Geopyxis carbonaria]
FPAAFGDPLRNFKRHCHELKAAEWRTVALIAAFIFLRCLHTEEDYLGYVNLVSAVMLLEKHSLCTNEIQVLGERIVKFSEYYEARFYQQKWNNLKFCLPVLRQSVLHCVDAVRWIGPMHVYTKCAMERV